MKQLRGSLDSRYVMVRNLSLHYRVSTNPTPASDETIVMVHGLVVSSRYMQPTARLLAPHYRVYTPDLPGWGKSQRPAHIPDLPELADILADWMAAVGLQQANFVANSVGCQVMAQLALRHPERVKRLILTAPTMDPRARTTPRQVIRWLRNGPYEPLSLYWIILRDYLDIGFHRFAVTLGYSLRDPFEHHLPQIQMPVQIVRGTHDTVVPQQWAEEVTRLLPQGQLTVLQGAAHDLNYSSAPELASLIHAFIAPQPPHDLETPAQQH